MSRVARERMQPSARPGKMVELLHSAVRGGGEDFIRLESGRRWGGEGEGEGAKKKGLGNEVRTDLEFLPFPFHIVEWAPSGTKHLAVGPCVQVLRHGLVQVRRIAQGEDNGSLDVPGHLTDDFGGEGAGPRRCPDENMRPHSFDGGE